MKTLFATVGLGVALTAFGPAAAQAQDRETLDQIATFASTVPWQQVGANALERARRSVAIGPFVGLHGAISADGSDPTTALSFGLGVSTFDVPIVPDRAEIEDVLKERFKTLFRQKLGEAMQGRLDGEPVDLEAIAKQAWTDVLNAYLQGRRHKRWEQPRFRAHLEGARLFQNDAWQARGTVAAGLGSLSYGLTLGGAFADSNAFFLGPEVSAQLLFGTARTRIVDLFARVDFPIGSDNSSQISLGARFFLDII